MNSPSKALPVAQSIIGNINPQQLLALLVGEVNDWVKVIQEEGTKRTAIDAQRQVMLAQIDARRDIFITYLERSFDERAVNFDALFTRLEAACTAGNSADIATILGAITALAAKSPFADLHDLDLVKANLGDADYEWVV